MTLDSALQAFRGGQLQESEMELEALWAESLGDSAVAALYGQVLRAAGRWEEAIRWFEQALRGDPLDSRPRIAIGQILRLEGRQEEAQTNFEQAVLQSCLALAVTPDQADRLTELALAYGELGAKGDAIDAFLKALALDPNHVEAHRGLAILLTREGRISEATVHQQALARLEPENLLPAINLAFSLHEAGDPEGCLARLEALQERAPTLSGATHAYLFCASTAGEDLQPRMREVAKDHWHRLEAADEQPEAPATATPQAMSLPQGPLRIGILTAEVGNHPVSHFLESLLRHHNRSRVQVDLIETLPRWEPRTFGLRAMAADVLLLPQAHLAERRRRISERGYHVIMETSGFTSASGIDLLAVRLAPVQCHWVGFHASTFLPTIDWFLADADLLPPELEYQFTERIWRLPRPWAAYTPPAPFPQAQSDVSVEGPVFGSFNQMAKLGSKTIAFWSAVLGAIPDARLLVKNRNTADPILCQHLREALVAAGVAPERVAFEGWAPSWVAHMESYNRIDVALDTTPWSSATTAFEAVAMGIPLLAIRGHTLAGRMSTAVLAGAGMQNWIADTPEEFAALAVNLTSNLETLRSNRQARQQHALRTSLFDGADLACHLTDAFLGMIKSKIGSSTTKTLDTHEPPHIQGPDE